ncbi:hypothetical protein KEM56_004415 [Ascosphaera pollenicola]|nr:hypothetical protein KEM56_004415 [Ascosphaera pollenicola]
MDERTGRPVTPVADGDSGAQNGKEKGAGGAIPRPSASIILISPDNEVLLLHRVKDSSSFPSAHVFPGGNLSEQDGKLPAERSYQRHFENEAYRRAAVRELFEESGILLARNTETKNMINVDHLERERGRNAIHAGEIRFDDWLKNQDQHAEPDIENLIPFTHWITPTGLRFARRYTTQMYLYLLPITTLSTYDSEVDFQDPTPDGEIEITSAKFLSATEWLRLARSGSVIMFPPQILLLTLISQFLDPSTPWPSDEELEARRAELMKFIHGDRPPWTQRYMSPSVIGLNPDKRLILGLDSPGRELEGSKVKGDSERVILVNFRKDGPREVEVRWKKEVLAKLDKGRL